MDKLDKLTIAIVAAMSLYGAALLALDDSPPQAGQAGRQESAVAQYAISPELDNKIKLAGNLLAQDNLAKTELLVNSLLTAYPFEGKLYMLKGDILMRRQQPVAAMYEYKEAVGLNPDFLDKKTPLFQGKKIKVTVEEAMAAIEIGLQESPNSSKLKLDRKTVYFMKRKIAGSCG